MAFQTTHPSSELSSDFKSLCKFFFPVLFMTITSNVVIFIEKILFGLISADALTVSIDVNFIVRIFQVTFVYLASLTQVYVGQWYGARDYHKIGPGVWQLIWFSIFSLFLTLPMGLWIGKLYFKGTSLSSSALPYLYTYIGINFLYPLKATLVGFYLGRGKAAWVTRWIIGADLLQLLISSVLILGIPGLFPSWGLMGGATSHLIIQSILCFFLLLHFFFSATHVLYNTHRWKCEPKLFWELIQPGLFRVAMQTLQAPSWVAISYIMTQLGGSYALVLSVGVTLFYFLACLGNALQTSVMSMNAQFIGAKAYHLIKASLNNTRLLLCALFVPLAIPMLIFSRQLYRFLFPKIELEALHAPITMKLIWMCLLTHAISSILTGIILAFKDTRFLIIAGLWSLIYDLGICAFLGMKIMNISPVYFWLMISIGHLLISCIYYWRIQHLRYRFPITY
jgi:MATE family multidrug resistance protein